MLTIQSLREEKDLVIRALEKRHFDAKDSIEQILQWDAERRATQSKLDDALAKSNELSSENAIRTSSNNTI